MLKPHNMFHTPKNWDEVERWINRHSSDERIHLLTAAMMTWNLAAKTVSWDGHEHESETMQQWSYPNED